LEDRGDAVEAVDVDVDVDVVADEGKSDGRRDT
jgi:hypothetical protein